MTMVMCCPQLRDISSPGTALLCMTLIKKQLEMYLQFVRGEGTRKPHKVCGKDRGLQMETLTVTLTIMCRCED